MADSSPGRTYAGAKLKLMLIPMGGVVSMDKPKVAELNAATALDIFVCSYQVSDQDRVY